MAMLDPRADDAAIFNHGWTGVQAVRATLGSVGRSQRAPASPGALRDHLNTIAECWQAKPVPKAIGLAGTAARMVDPQWWTRNLRRELLREAEAIEHAQGRVRRRGEVYVSDHAMTVKRRRNTQNRRTLERLEVANEEGEAFNLLEVADASVSNPKLRRAELMVRCRGFEETAAFMGHEAVFLTLTCPSRFHRFNAQGLPNERWKGATPRDAQKYLNSVWAKIRAEWKRRGFSPYGFRVAEPHHDGCPHWHLLLFVPPDQAGWFVPRRAIAGRDDAGAGVVGIAGQYALDDSPHEPGAIEHRFTCKRIDPAAGSATGYIAKYISKNIDGQIEGGGDMGLDFASGKNASDTAPRVRTWASTWGIRQFQQIGGPSVTVWREMRRLSDGEVPAQLELFENIRSAADRALWALFWVLQGGPDVPRNELLKPRWAEGENGKYGDPVKRVDGVQSLTTGESLLTRFHTWTVQRAGLADVDAREGERLHRRDLGKRFPDMARLGVFDPAPEFKRSGAAAQPWTGVNNCTDSVDDDENAALMADLMRGGGGQTLKVPHEIITFAASEPRGSHYRGVQERSP